MDRNPTETLKKLLAQDKVIPVIGAGVSSAVAGLPGWKQALEHGFKFAGERWLSRESILEGKKLLEDGLLTKSADILKKLLNCPRHPFATWLDQLFGQPEIRNKVLLTKIHELCCPMILTTNYDNLIFKTSIVGQKMVFDWSEFQEVHQAVHRSEEFILHLHGRVNKPETIILSSDDYQKLSEQLGYKAVLQSLWMNYHFLFIGCSKDGILDDDFITILNFLKKWFPSNPHQHFILVNERNVQNGEHLELLFDCNIEPISYGTEYDELPGTIEAINPNKNKLESKIKRIIEAYLNVVSVDNVVVEDILTGSTRFKAWKNRLAKLQEDFDAKKKDGYFDNDLYEQIQEVEKSMTNFKREVTELINRFPDLKKLLGDCTTIEDFVNTFNAKDLDTKAQELRLENEKLKLRGKVASKKLKQLADEFLLMASFAFMNVDDPNREVVAISFIEKALRTFEDLDILEAAARFYKNRLGLSDKGAELYEKVVHLELDVVHRMMALYTLGTMYISFDKKRARKHLSKFCLIASNLKANHPFLQTLYANGLHNLASCIEDPEAKLETLEEAILVRRLAAKANPNYFSSLAYTLTPIFARFADNDKMRFENAFDEALEAMEQFLALSNKESVDFFEEDCLAGLILGSVGFSHNKMIDKFNGLKPKFRDLLKEFDAFVTSFKPECCLGVALAYHEYFLIFKMETEFVQESNQWMLDRSILHLKNSFQYSLPNDKLYYMLTYSLTFKWVYLFMVEKDHTTALFVLKEALSHCRKINKPDSRGIWLLAELTRLDETECECEDCLRARGKWRRGSRQS